MQYQYKEFEIDSGKSTARKKTILRPMIPVIILHNKQYVMYEALLDSGSDYNIFPSEIADILGLSLSKGKRKTISGIGKGTIKGYEHEVTFRIGDKTIITKAIFSTGFPSHAFGALGNDGFFSHFRILFNYNDRTIEIN